MAEMPDVVTLTTISSDWGNDLRDRSVQRYSSVANRTTEHPTPAEGDLSYLEDSNTLDVYTGAAWTPFLLTNEVDGYSEVASAALTTSLANVATVSLTIPAGWGSWKCFASASWMAVGVSTVTWNARLLIDGTALQTLVRPDAGSAFNPASLVGRRTGMTTTGARTIALQGSEGAGDDVTFSDITLYARAVRLT